MKKFIAAVVLMVSMTGCQSFGSGFVEGVEEKVRLKWAEEWRPAIEAELASELAEAKESVLNATTAQIELQEEKTKARLASVNVRIEDYDRDQDGKVTGAESAELLAALKAARDEDGKPLNWIEILMAVVLGYGGTTAGKEWVKSKMTGTGDGTQPA
jgi:hypothetical protein